MYNAEQFQSVRDRIENSRLAAQAEADRRTEEVHQKSPEIREIDEKLTKTGLRLFKTACGGGDITALREENQALVKKRGDLLLALGLPENYTEPPYACPLCQDSGYVGTKMCDCLRKALIRENIKTSGFGNLLGKQTFDNFDLSYYRADGEEIYTKMQTTVSICKHFSENFAKEHSNLLFCGATGTGKTHLSTAIAMAALEQGYHVQYESAQNIVSAFENDHFRTGSQKEEPASNKYLECDLLIVDDLGTEFTSQFALSCLYNLFNTRGNRGLSTVVSTNLKSTELKDRYETRIYSRLIGEYQIVSCQGHDHRLPR